jgi:hypothetical protein
MDTSKAGFVYILQMEGHDYYKIGRTTDINRRVCEIKPQMPGRLTLLLAHRVRNAWVMEANLHRDFSGRRMNGEWFNLNSSEIERIRLTLLSVQTLELTERIVAHVKMDSESVPWRLEQLGRIFILLTRRLNRRVEALKLISIPEDILSAEYIG